MLQFQRGRSAGIGAMNPFESYIEPPTSVVKPKPARLDDVSNRAAQLATQREFTALARQFSTIVSSKTTRFANSSSIEWTQRGSGYTPPSLIWTNHLQQDLYAVAQEADLPQSTAAAVVAAARSGAVSCNPGVILLQVMQLHPLQELLGRRPLLQILRKMPAILNHDPTNLAMNFNSLSPAFGTQQLTEMLAKCPRLLVSSPFTVWGNLQALSELAGLSLEDAAVLVARQPRLLVNSPAALRLRFDMLGQLIGLPEMGVQRLVRQQPALLSYFPETLEGNMVSMMDALGLPLQHCSRLVQRQPSLLMLCSSSLKEKVRALAALLLAHPQQSIQSVVLKQPSVLTLSTESLVSKLEQLQKILDLTHQEAQTLLLEQPALLTLSSGGLATKLQSLRAAVAAMPEWQAQLAAARPKTLAAWLCFSKDRHQRFAVVSQALADQRSRAAGGGSCSSLPSTVADESAAAPPAPSADPSCHQGSGTAAHSSQRIPSLPNVLKMQEAQFQALFSSSLSIRGGTVT